MSDVSRLVPGVRTARGKEDVDMECLFQVCEHAAVSLRAMADPIHRIGSDLWGVRMKSWTTWKVVHVFIRR